MGDTNAKKEDKILDYSELMSFLYEKIQEQVAICGVLQTIDDLEIPRSLYYDLKKYVEDKEVRENRKMPVSIDTAQRICKSLHIEYSGVLYVLRV